MAPSPAAAAGAAAPAARRFDIAALRFIFDAAEDRLRAEALDAAGRRETIWLTRRMGDAVIAALAKHLARLPPGRSGAAIGAAQGVHAPTAVPPGPATGGAARAVTAPRPWLCRRARVRPQADGLLLELAGNAGVVARASLSRFGIQGILLSLLTAYRRAQWPLAPFPADLRAADAAPSVPREKLH